jgi:hypothetical protein
MRPSDLLLILGSGASHPMPAGLPMFDPIRNEILRQIELDATSARATAVLTGMARELFLHAVEASGVSAMPWLAAVLGGGEPNAVHVAIATLAPGKRPGVDVEFR